MQRPRPRRVDHGASAVEYGAVLILVSALLGALVFALDPGGGMLSAVDRAVCTLTGGDCESADPQADGAPEPAGGDPEPADGDPLREQSDAEPEAKPSGPGGSIPKPPTMGGTTSDTDKTDEELRDETAAVLEETEIGRESLEYLADSSLDVTWERGEGGYWDGVKIQIDGSWTPDQRASTVVHELTHDQMGAVLPEDFGTREEYREAMADYETQALLNELAMFEELEQARGDDFAKPPRQLNLEHIFMETAEEASEDAYDEVYSRVIEESVEDGNYGADPEGATAAAERQAEKAADRAFEDARYDALMDHYLDGDAVGSNSGEAYVDVWDRRYEEEHGGDDSDGGGCGGFLWHECW